MRGSVERDLELLQLPVAEVVRSDEDGTRRGRVHTLGELPLPAPARSQAPHIEPRLEPGLLQPSGDPLDDGLVTAVVRQEDVEGRRLAHYEGVPPRRQAVNPAGPDALGVAATREREIAGLIAWNF